MPYRTAERRIKAAWYRLLQAWLYVVYRFRLWRLGIDERWIRSAFSAVAQMDVGEWLKVPGYDLWFKAWGNEIHIKESCATDAAFLARAPNDIGTRYECVIKEGLAGVVYVDEWRKRTREITLEYGSKHATHWWEVFRTGRRAESTRFIQYLKILYGEGLCSKVTSNGASTSQHIQP